MKNSIIAVLSLIVIALITVLLLNPQGNNILDRQISYSGKVIAKVDGQEIYEDEIKERLNIITSGQADQINLDQMDDEALDAFAKEIAVQRIILEKAKKADLEKDEKFADFVSRTVQNIYKEKYLEDLSKQNITEEETRKVYEDLIEKAKGSKQYKVSHILLDSEDKAKKLLAKATKENFAQLAKDNSIDKLSAAKGGDLGYIFPQEFVIEFADAIKKAEIGSISGPVKTQFGYHLIKVDDEKETEILSFELSKERIKQQIQARHIKEYVNELVETIKIELVK